MREFGQTHADIHWKRPAENLQREPEHDETLLKREDFLVGDQVANYMDEIRSQSEDLELSKETLLDLEEKLRIASREYYKKDTKLSSLFKTALTKAKSRISNFLGIIGAVATINAAVDSRSAHASSAHTERSMHTATFETSGTDAQESVELEAVADELRELVGDQVVDRMLSLEHIDPASRHETMKASVNGFENCPVFLSNKPITRIVETLQKHIDFDLESISYIQQHVSMPSEYGMNAHAEVLAYADSDSHRVVFYQGVDDKHSSEMNHMVYHELAHLFAPEKNTRLSALDRLNIYKRLAYFIIKHEPTARLLPPGVDTTPSPELPFDPGTKPMIKGYDGKIYDDKIYNANPQLELNFRINEIFPELVVKYLHGELRENSEEEKIVEDVLTRTNPNIDLSALRGELISVGIENEEDLNPIPEDKRSEQVAQAE